MTDYGQITFISSVTGINIPSAMNVYDTCNPTKCVCVCVCVCVLVCLFFYVCVTLTLCLYLECVSLYMVYCVYVEAHRLSLCFLVCPTLLRLTQVQVGVCLSVCV